MGHFLVSVSYPVKVRRGQGKDMVPEPPHLRSCSDWDSDQLISSQPLITSSQLNSFESESCVPFVVQGARGLNEDGGSWSEAESAGSARLDEPATHC